MFKSTDSKRRVLRAGSSFLLFSKFYIVLLSRICCHGGLHSSGQFQYSVSYFLNSRLSANAFEVNLNFVNILQNIKFNSVNFLFFCRGLEISLSVTFGRLMIVFSNTIIDYFIYKCCFIVMISYAALIFYELYISYYNMHSIIISFFLFQSMR